MLSDTTYEAQYIASDGTLGRKSIVHHNRLKGVRSQAQIDILAEAQQRQEAVLSGRLGVSDEQDGDSDGEGVGDQRGSDNNIWRAHGDDGNTMWQDEHRGDSGLLKEATAVVHRQRAARKKSSSTSAPMKTTTPASGLPSAGVEAEAACDHRMPAAVAASWRLVCQQAAGEPRNDDAWLVAGHEVVQWVNKLEVMEDKIRKRETNLKRVRGHLEAAKRYMTDFTNPVECHEQMITEIPWTVRPGRTLSDRQVAVNEQAQMLTQRLMSVTRQAVQAEAVMR